MKKYEYNTGGQLGTSIGTAATTFIPGVGPALAPIGGFIGGKIGSLFNKKKKVPDMRTKGYASQGYMENGGILSASVVPLGGGAEKYHGPKHEQGGIPVNSSGDPTKSNAIAEVEGGETKQGNFIFSDSLKVPNTNMTFAEAHEKLIKRGGDQSKVRELMQMQEKMKKEAGTGQTGLPKKQYGGLAGAVSGIALDTANKKDNKMGLLNTAQYIIPSAARVGIALNSRKPRKVKPISAEKIPTESQAFTEAKTSLASGFRANPTQGGYAQFTRGVNQIASQESAYKNRAQQFNVQSQQRADIYNSRIEQGNIERQAQEQAAKTGLIYDAITQPLTAATADRRGKQQMIANLLSSADRINNPTDWARRVRVELRAVGMSNEEIEKIIDGQTNLRNS